MAHHVADQSPMEKFLDRATRHSSLDNVYVRHPPCCKLHTDFDDFFGLGFGSFGNVVKCRNIYDGKDYAVKIIEINTDRFYLKDSKEKEVMRILREVKAMSDLTHPNIVRYYHSWAEERTEQCRFREERLKGEEDAEDEEPDEDAPPNWRTEIFIAMQFCERSLGKKMKEGLIDDELVWEYFKQLITGVDFIHSHGYLHRDLSPSNIFIDCGKILIGDFGCCRTLHLNALDVDGGNICSSSVGVKLYRAPEIKETSTTMGNHSDVYSCGVILMEMFTRFSGGRPQWEYEMRVFHDTGDFPSECRCSEEVKTFIRRLTSPKYLERPSTTNILRLRVLGGDLYFSDI